MSGLFAGALWFKEGVRGAPRLQIEIPASERYVTETNYHPRVRLAGEVNLSIQLEADGSWYGGDMYVHDKGTNRKTMLVGLMFCVVFVLVSYFAKPQIETDRVLVKADRLTLTAGKPPLAD